MKFKLVGVLCLILLIVVGATNLSANHDSCDYLRLHIRANSNLEIDQNVKYEIKDLLLDYLTPMLCNVQSKQKAIEIVNKSKERLTFLRLS